MYSGTESEFGGLTHLVFLSHILHSFTSLDRWNLRESGWFDLARKMSWLSRSVAILSFSHYSNLYCWAQVESSPKAYSGKIKKEALPQVN
jgi:hypothetical protein